MAQNPKPDPELVHKGLALQEAGKPQQALDLYRKFLVTLPDHPEVLNFCGLACYDLGQNDQALDYFRQATAVEPNMLQAWNNMGLLYQSLGKLEQALSAFQHITATLTDQPSADAHHNVANVLYQLGRGQQALQEFMKVTTLQPENADAQGKLAVCYLDTGHWQAALNAIEAGLETAKSNTGLLALKSVALRELGLDDDFQNLVDCDRLIQRHRFDAVENFQTMDDFNRALSAHVSNHPTLMFEPSENTTTKGYQSGDLMKSEKGPVASLEKLITSAVNEYMHSLTPDPSHPFLKNPPENWTINAWATILNNEGHQASHIHRDAWLSGCYYVQLPDLMAGDNNGREGWIVFGEPADYPLAAHKPEPAFFKPETSSLFLFPSYFYHRTVPFKSDQNRISIAFDIIPA